MSQHNRRGSAYLPLAREWIGHGLIALAEERLIRLPGPIANHHSCAHRVASSKLRSVVVIPISSFEAAGVSFVLDRICVGQRGIGVHLVFGCEDAVNRTLGSIPPLAPDFANDSENRSE